MVAEAIQTFGQRVRAIREGRKMRRADVAAYSDFAVSKAGLFRIETESRVNPKLMTLVALCSTLGMRIVVDPEGVIVEEINPWAPPGRMPE